MANAKIPSTSTAPAQSIVALSASATAFPVCRGLLVGTGGTADITDAKGNNVDGVPLQAGYNPLAITKLRALGTAADVFALY